MDLQDYFERIGHRGPISPDLATLTALIQHQAASIPFEAIDVLLGLGVNMSPASVFDKLVGRKRGGYCFEQNVLLRTVLEALGFEVEPLLARVLWMRPANEPKLAPTHMALAVTIGGKRYLADAGFGNGTPTAPLELENIGPQPTLLETFRILPVAGGRRLDMRLGEKWLPVYETVPGPRRAKDFTDANEFASRHPNSRFLQDLILARATPEARFLQVGNKLTIRQADGTAERRWQKTPEALADVLETVFGLSVEHRWHPLLERFTSAQE